MGWKIAICDDDAGQAAQLQADVTDWAHGACAVTCFPSAEAFRFAGDTDWDILLLDVEMPGMSGIDLAKRLRGAGCRAEIIFITSHFECMAEGEYGHLFCLAFALVFGAIGFLDDYEKLKKKQNLGLTAGKKLLLQLAAAVAFIFLMRRFGYVALDSLYIPFWNKTVPVSEPLYVIFAAFVIVGTVNSVNLTDGVDGLAASTTMPVCIFFAVISMLWGERFLSLGVFASGLAGGLLGFLIYNFHPAKVFMGDTGSLFLGGAVAALAFAYDMPLILVTLGIMYIIEALSDIIQVGYFKLTHGKRVFKMSPFHHHLEMGGWTGHKWKETQIVALFAGVTVLFAVLSFIGVFHRFGV